MPGNIRESPYLSALKEGGNCLGMAGAVALTFALTNPVPFLAGLLAEAAYLVLVPDSKWYAARLAKRFDAEIEKRREEQKAQILPTLRQDMRDRYSRLEAARQSVAAQASTDTWLREVLRKLDYLLDKFLQFAGREVQFRTYLLSMLSEIRASGRGPNGRSAPDPAPAARPRHDPPSPQRRSAPQPGSLAGSITPEINGPMPAPRSNARQQGDMGPAAQSGADTAGGVVKNGPAGFSDMSDPWVERTIRELQAFYENELDGLKTMRDAETDANTKAVLAKRCDVLQRRSEYIVKIGQAEANLNHQLCLVEDTFGLINDEMRARPPEQVLADIEDVVTQTNTMSQLLEEMGPL